MRPKTSKHRVMEHQLYHPLIMGANAEGWLLYRVTDLAVGRKPFDIGGVAPDGRAVAIEVKRVGSDPPDAPFPWAIFRPHQIGWLRGYATRGGLALAILYDEDLQLPTAYAIRSLDFDPARTLEPRARISQAALRRHENQFRGWDRLLLF